MVLVGYLFRRLNKLEVELDKSKSDLYQYKETATSRFVSHQHLDSRFDQLNQSVAHMAAALKDLREELSILAPRQVKVS